MGELSQLNIKKVPKLKSINYYIEHLVLIGLFGTLMLPSINIGIGVNAITFVSLILILLLPFLVIKNKVQLNRFAVWWSVILIAMFYSINHSYISLDVKSSYRDYMELFRYMQVLPYLLVASIINYETFEKKLIKYLNISIIYILFIAFLQITNIANLGYISGLIYSSEGHTYAMFAGAHRILLTGSDPNVGAVIVSFLLMLTFSIKENKIYKNFKIISLILILLMTQSRTVFLGLTFSFLLYMLIFSKINFFIKIFIVSFTIFIVYQLLHILNLEYILIGFQMALEGTNSSLNVRFENVILAYERFLETMVLGWGPAKSIHDTVIDSEYALILQRYGLVGMFLFLGYLTLLVNLSTNLYKKQISSKINIPLVAFLISSIGFVVMATNTFFAGYQVVAIITLISVGLISYRNNLKYINLSYRKK